MAEAVFRCFFPGRVRLFGKTNGHSRESLATNTAGKNALSQRRNKAERNCRHTQGTQQIKSRSCRTVFLCGSFCFSVLICTPNTGCPVLGVHIIFAYFSVCTQNRINYFSDIVISNASEPATVRLTRFGKIAEEQIKAINFKYVDVDIENYVIMPNHIHMIVSTFYDNEKDNNISVTDVVRIFKSLTTRLCKVGPVIFQRSFYDHIIRNDTDYSRILNYINNNPSKWEEDSLYNSAKTVTVL